MNSLQNYFKLTLDIFRILIQLHFVTLEHDYS